MLIYDEGNTLVASGAALVGADQPCVLLPQNGQTVGMVDAELGWHLLVTTTGTESQREIRISPSVDLPDEIHPAYADDGMGLARATAAIDEAAHYIDDVAVTCPLGLGAGLGDIANVPVDGAAVVGQVESVTWTATPDGTTEQAAIRRHVAIAPESYMEPVVPTPPSVADDTETTDSETATSGYVLANDATGLTVVAVNGLAANVGVEVSGSDGGIFTIASDGAWTFDPDGDFVDLEGVEYQGTSITYHASDGTSEAAATLTVNVTAPAVPLGIQLIGSATGQINTTATSYDVDLPAGTNIGDLVLVMHGWSSASITGADVLSPGYQKIIDLYRDDTRDTTFEVSYKMLTEIETSVSLEHSGGGSNYAGSAVVLVFRGVDSTNPLDVSVTASSGKDSSIANPPAITPVTDGAMAVICIGCVGYAYIAGDPPSGFTDPVVSFQNGGYAGFAAGSAIKKWYTGDGTIDPASWQLTTTHSYFTWCSAMVALRPA